MKRRDFIIAMNSVAGSLLLGKKGFANEKVSRKEFNSILIDTTRCMGCLSCEYSCAEANGLPEPDYDDSVLENRRKTSVNQRTVVNRYEVENEEIFVKTQCMHCNQPACASACLTKAMEKTPDGPVIWNGNKCMGCRYCMISCPFDVPKFEYHEANPKIEKCNMCFSRLNENEQPACVENCPNEVLFFGKRRNVLKEARRRIYSEPDKYNNHIYGEHEAGGTGIMYLASTEFSKLGFKEGIDNKPYPEFTKGFLYAVPVVLTLWPAILLGINKATKKDEKE